MQDRILLAVSGALSLISLIFASYKQFQMLQQNSYFPSRYFKWLKGSYPVGLCFDAMLFCLASVIFLAGKYVIECVFFAAVCIIRIIDAARTHKKSVKKLVFTARIKRLFAAETLVSLLLILLFVFSSVKLISEISFVLLVMLSSVPPLAVLLSRLLMTPVEAGFCRYYIKDAEKILKSVPCLKIIGITGSYGKTTTKFILTRILSERFNTVCTPQSFNTPMGVVRTVRSEIKPQTEVFVCEMGAKKSGDIKEICDIVHPDIGIITSVGEQHLDTFGSVGNVYKTKFELEKSVSEKGGMTFVNAESPEIKKRLSGKVGTVPYGEGTEIRAENISCSSLGASFDIVMHGERISVSTSLLGMHAVSDILAAAAAADALGVSAQDIKVSVASLKPTEHRLELKSYLNGSLLIDDAYNSNPVGCLEAVRTLGRFKGMRKVIITPGLVELGEKEYDCNFALGAEAAKYCDEIILVGKTRSEPLRAGALSQNFDPERLHTVSSFKDAMKIYSPSADKNSILLIENDLPDNYLD